VIAEGNETPGGEPGAGEGRSRRSEGDLLAERRARRAAESGEHSLTLRAEAAEATVRTLEAHVASLQQRMREAEEEHRRTSDAVEAEQAPHSAAGWRSPAPAAEEIERELRRVSQREYAEQRLRIEAEDRCVEIERDGRAENDRLSLRLSTSEREARALAARLEIVQRELAEAEQSAAAELADLRSAAGQRSEHALQARLAELERRIVEVRGGLEVERGARLRAERLLEEMRGSQRTAVALLAELGEVLARLKRDTAEPEPEPAPARELAPPPESALAPDPLPAPVSALPAPGGEAPLARGAQTRPVLSGAAAEARSGEMAEALVAAVERLRARVEEQPEPAHAPAAKAPSHKHSMSLIAHWRLASRRRREARKQRRER
jgi:hypothetical protein